MASVLRTLVPALWAWAEQILGANPLELVPELVLELGLELVPELVLELGLGLGLELVRELVLELVLGPEPVLELAPRQAGPPAVVLVEVEAICCRYQSRLFLLLRLQIK